MNRLIYWVIISLKFGLPEIAKKKVCYENRLFSWYTRQDSNLRHLVPKTSALIH